MLPEKKDKRYHTNNQTGKSMSELKIDEISIVFPCDLIRMPLLLHTLAKYHMFGIPEKVEVILVSRTFTEMVIPGIDIKVVHYSHEGEYFCPSLAFNLGVKKAQYKNIIIGHPEVKPVNNVLDELFKLERGNYVCRVFDLDEEGQYINTLIGTGCREEWPGLYFLACYRREDIEAINGWDMRFMEGYSNEDIDFGQRMVNAGIPWSLKDDIKGVHQFHSRGTDDCQGYSHNRKLYEENKRLKVTKAIKGLHEC